MADQTEAEPRQGKRGLTRALLSEADGFATWVAHVTDDHGNGALLSWGFGHPEARSGPEPAGEVPALSLLIYATEQPSLWLHQRYGAGDATWTTPAGAWQFGGSRIEALTDLAAQVVIARLDCALPGTRDRLTGIIDLGAPPLRGSDDESRDQEDWQPLTGPGRGRVMLQVGKSHHYNLVGTAYHHRFGARQRGSALAFGHATVGDEQRAYRLFRSGDGALVAAGVVVQADGRYAHSRLSVDVEEEDGRWRRLLLREGGSGWLDVEITRALHERGGGRHLLTRNRAPMVLPVPGVLTVVDAPSRTTTKDARRFLHDLTRGNPIGSRLENGPVRGRYWRLLGR